MQVSLNAKSFQKTLNNAINYSFGFLDGIENGKKIFLDNLGKSTILGLKAYVDTMAKLNPSSLHHVYEWYQTGSPSARLFDLDYTVSGIGLSIKSTFRQSRTLSQDSKVPFYNKAKIMEEGIPVTIKPKSSGVLVFKEEATIVFTKKAVHVNEPGGTEVQGSFERVVDEFILRYFKQSFLRASGLYEYINNPIVYKKNFAAGSKMGRSKGVETGFKWIVNAKVGVE